MYLFWGIHCFGLVWFGGCPYEFEKAPIAGLGFSLFTFGTAFQIASRLAPFAMTLQVVIAMNGGMSLREAEGRGNMSLRDPQGRGKPESWVGRNFKENRA